MEPEVAFASSSATSVLALETILDVEQLPGPVRESLLGRGRQVVPQLLHVVQGGQRDQYGETRDSGWAALHAVALLAELEATESIRPLVALVASGQMEATVGEEINEALGKMGPAVGPEVVAALPSCSDPLWHRSLLDVLVKCGYRGEDVFERLVAELHRDPDSGAGLLTEYGDPRAVAILRERLVARELDEESPNPFKNHPVIEMCAAIERLGGTLTGEEALKERRAKYLGRISFNRRFSGSSGAPPRTPLQTDKTPGRNDPCHCGSGTKYKKCHGGKS